MKQILLSILIFTFAHSANAGVYCTDSNWNKLSTLFNESARSYNRLVKEIDEYEIKTKASAFIHNRYSLEEYSSMWNMNNDVDRKSVEGFIANTNKQIKRIEKFNTHLKIIKKDGRNLEHNWEKLAEYCYDEDQYDNYKIAYKNYERSASNLKKTKELIDSLKVTKAHYYTELEFFVKTKELSK